MRNIFTLSFLFIFTKIYFCATPYQSEGVLEGRHKLGNVLVLNTEVPYTLQCKNSQLFLASYPESTLVGQVKHANEKWVIKKGRSGGYCLMKQDDDFVLQAPGDKHGCISLAKLVEGNVYQEWTFKQEGAYLFILNLGSGLPLNGWGTSMGPGTITQEGKGFGVAITELFDWSSHRLWRFDKEFLARVTYTNNKREYLSQHIYRDTPSSFPDIFSGVTI